MENVLFSSFYYLFYELPVQTISCLDHPAGKSAGRGLTTFHSCCCRANLGIIIFLINYLLAGVVRLAIQF
jgi:hypothetical protein